MGIWDSNTVLFIEVSYMIRGSTVINSGGPN